MPWDYLKDVDYWKKNDEFKTHQWDCNVLALDNASIGGVFKDFCANWLCGFVMRTDNCKDTIFKAESRIVLEGLDNWS